ncbi:hypothetical protein ACJX0J_039409, partial [Zea mays]
MRESDSSAPVPTPGPAATSSPFPSPGAATTTKTSVAAVFPPRRPSSSPLFRGDARLKSGGRTKFERWGGVSPGSVPSSGLPFRDDVLSSSPPATAAVRLQPKSRPPPLVRRSTFRTTPRLPAGADAEGWELVESRRAKRLRLRALWVCRHGPSPSAFNGVCFNCLSPRHLARHCRLDSRSFNCLALGHKAASCPGDPATSPVPRVHSSTAVHPVWARLGGSVAAGSSVWSRLGGTKGPGRPISVWGRISPPMDRSDAGRQRLVHAPMRVWRRKFLPALGEDNQQHSQPSINGASGSPRGRTRRRHSRKRLAPPLEEGHLVPHRLERTTQVLPSPGVAVRPSDLDDRTSFRCSAWCVDPALIPESRELWITEPLQSPENAGQGFRTLIYQVKIHWSFPSSSAELGPSLSLGDLGARDWARQSPRSRSPPGNGRGQSSRPRRSVMERLGPHINDGRGNLDGRRSSASNKRCSGIEAALVPLAADLGDIDEGISNLVNRAGLEASSVTTLAPVPLVPLMARADKEGEHLVYDHRAGLETPSLGVSAPVFMAASSPIDGASAAETLNCVHRAGLEAPSLGVSAPGRSHGILDPISVRGGRSRLLGLFPHGLCLYILEDAPFSQMLGRTLFLGQQTGWMISSSVLRREGKSYLGDMRGMIAPLT